MNKRPFLFSAFLMVLLTCTVFTPKSEAYWDWVADFSPCDTTYLDVYDPCIAAGGTGAGCKGLAGIYYIECVGDIHPPTAELDFCTSAQQAYYTCASIYGPNFLDNWDAYNACLTASGYDGYCR